MDPRHRLGGGIFELFIFSNQGILLKTSSQVYHCATENLFCDVQCNEVNERKGK